MIYTDVWQTVRDTDYFIYIYIGGRGVGKTYSSLRGALSDKKQFMYLRRTETELKNCCNESNNPFKTLNRDYCRDIHLKAQADGFLIVEDGDILGVAGALSTFGKFRGADYSDIDTIIFDEFISTQPRVTIKNEEFLFFNLLETVGRNRELEGMPHIKCVLLSNANTLNSGILSSLGLAEEVNKIVKKGADVWTDEERCIYLEMIDNDNFRKAKSQTALYKLTAGTEYNKMALDNIFNDLINDDVHRIDHRLLVPFVSIDNITIYNVKGSNKQYVSYRKADCEHYDINDLKRWQHNYSLWFTILLMQRRLIYQDYNIKLKFQNLLTNK